MVRLLLKQSFQYAMGHEGITIRQMGEPGDLGWIVMAQGQAYAHEFGWSAEFEALAARIVADYATGHDDAREAAWIAESGSHRVGCVFCVAASEGTAKLRLLFVDPSARGRGLGARLVDRCLTFARQAGYARVTLWTNHPLQAARKIYLSRGFTLVREQPHHSFGVDLVGQTYELDLVPSGLGDHERRAARGKRGHIRRGGLSFR